MDGFQNFSNSYEFKDRVLAKRNDAGPIQNASVGLRGENYNLSAGGEW